jgi:hypothetical protein
MKKREPIPRPVVLEQEDGGFTSLTEQSTWILLAYKRRGIESVEVNLVPKNTPHEIIQALQAAIQTQ